MEKKTTPKEVEKMATTTPALPVATTASERRRLRKAGLLVDWNLDGTRTRTATEERRHERSMAKWARHYDSLNGAPESGDDR